MARIKEFLWYLLTMVVDVNKRHIRGSFITLSSTIVLWGFYIFSFYMKWLAFESGHAKWADIFAATSEDLKTIAASYVVITSVYMYNSNRKDIEFKKMDSIVKPEKIDDELQDRSRFGGKE